MLCKKYEEGTSLSFLSKKARIAGEWELEKYFEDGDDDTDECGENVISHHEYHLKAK